MITINWTPAFVAALAALHQTQQGEVFIRNHCQNWILTQANNWALGVPQSWWDPALQKTYFAHVTAIVAAGRTVDVTNVT